MTLKMNKTELEDYSIQYPVDHLKTLNSVYSERLINNAELREVGQEVDSEAEHFMHPETQDGYTWFGGLQYTLEGSKIKILFPWTQDWDNPESQMDRSINVYSTKQVSDGCLSDLLENIAYQMALSSPRERNRSYI